MINNETSHCLAGILAVAVLAVVLAVVPGGCSAGRQLDGSARASRNDLVGSFPVPDTVTRPLDTIYLRDVELGVGDSAYVTVEETSARVVSVRMLLAGSSLVLIDSSAPGVIASGGGHLLLDLPNALPPSYVRRPTVRVDVEVVVAAAAPPRVKLCVDCELGGPEPADRSPRAHVAPSLCGGPWAVRARAGESIRTTVSPARPRGARPIRTLRWGPAARDTTAQISWNCLRDDGADAGRGAYQIQITVTNARGSSSRALSVSVDVGS